MGFYDGGQRPQADHDPTKDIQWEIQKLAGSIGADITAVIQQLVQAAVEFLEEKIKEIVDTIIGYVTDPESMLEDLLMWAINIPQLIDGLIPDWLIPGLDASKIITGIIGLAQLPAQVLTTISGVAASLVSGILGVGNIPGLDASKIISGVLNLAQLPTQVLTTITGVAAGLVSGLLAIGNIPGLDASKIISGAFPISMITGLFDVGGKILTSLLSVPISVITGLLSGGSILTSLIPGLDVSKIISGVFPTGMIPGLDVSKIISGIFPVGFIPGLDASKIVSGILNAVQIPGLDVAKIVTGVFGAGFIPGLDGSKIISGSIAQARLTITSLAASIIDSGIFGTARIPGLDTSKITSGTFPQSMVNITSIAAGIISGVLGTGNIPGLDVAKIITGTFGAGFIPGLDGSKIITGAIAQARLTITSLAASVIDSGIFGTARIPGLDTSKITSGNFSQSIITGLTDFLGWARTSRAAGTNLATDPGWENNALWASETLGVISTDQARSGTQSWKMIANGVSYRTAYIIRSDNGNSLAIRTQPGERFYVECWVWPDAANVGTLGTVAIVGRRYNSAGAPAYSYAQITHNATSLTKGQWNKIAGYVTMGAGHDRADFYVQVGNTTNNGDVYYFDDSIVREETATQGIIAQLFGGTNVLSTILAAAVPALDTSKITTGTFAQSMVNITSIGAGIVSGVLGVGNIPGLDVAKIVSGVFGTGFIPGLDTSKITSGTFAQSMVNITSIAAGIVSGVLGTGNIPSLDVAKITTGIFGAGFIPGLDGSKIVTGAIAQARLTISSLAASVIDSGTFVDARIPSLATSKITSGTFATSFIPALDVSKITTGIFGTGFIPNLDVAKITTGIFGAGFIPGLDGSKIISGSIAQARLTISSLAASVINSGTFADARIPGLDVGKIISGVFGTGFIPGLDASKVISGQFGQGMIPDITRGMSTGIQNSVDAIINGIFGTSDTGQSAEDAKDALAAIPTSIVKWLGGISKPQATLAEAEQAQAQFAGTVNSHTAAISSIQAAINESTGFQKIVNFKVPETWTTQTAGAFAYDPPSWAQYVDGVYLPPGGGGMGGNPIVPVHGEGGDASDWVTETLVRGVDFSGAQITGTIGNRGAAGGPNNPGGAGGNIVRNAISGGKAAVTAPGAAGGNVQNTSLATGDSPGNLDYNGGTYIGGNGGSSVSGQTGGHGGVGAGGGGGAGGTYLVAWAGGPGGLGKVSFCARAALDTSMTSMGTLILPTFRLNTGVAQTDAMTASATFTRIPPNGAAGGYMFIIRANAAFTNYVYLRVWYVGGVTYWAMGRVSSGVAATPWKTGTIGEAIPYNAFSISSDDSNLFTIAVNGSAFDTYNDAGATASKGTLYRNGGWATSETLAGGSGSILQFAFFDSGVPSRITSTTIATSQNTGSHNAYVNLATVGPTVTIDVPDSGEVLVTISAYIACSGHIGGYMGFEMSGANTAAASDTEAIVTQGVPAYAGTLAASRVFHKKGLNPGTTTFTAKYKSTAATVSFKDRSIIVDPRP